MSAHYASYVSDLELVLYLVHTILKFLLWNLGRAIPAFSNESVVSPKFRAATV
jgi:hypothetical protein